MCEMTDVSCVPLPAAALPTAIDVQGPLEALGLGAAGAAPPTQERIHANGEARWSRARRETNVKLLIVQSTHRRDQSLDRVRSES